MSPARAGTQTAERAPSRASRRKALTRDVLIDAALRIMAQTGVDAATIQQITAEADIAVGSFYSHFKDKDAIVDAVVRERYEDFALALDGLGQALSDPAELFAACVRHVVRRAMDDHTWGSFLVRLGFSPRYQELALFGHMTRDLRTAAAARRLSSDDLDGAVIAISGVVMACMGSAAQGRLRPDAAERTAALCLRLMGLPPREARLLARRPLPPVPSC